MRAFAPKLGELVFTSQLLPSFSLFIQPNSFTLICKIIMIVYKSWKFLRRGVALHEALASRW